jgi:hypothetical protein
MLVVCVSWTSDVLYQLVHGQETEKESIHAEILIFQLNFVVVFVICIDS